MTDGPRMMSYGNKERKAGPTDAYRSFTKTLFGIQKSNLYSRHTASSGSCVSRPVPGRNEDKR